MEDARNRTGAGRGRSAPGSRTRGCERGDCCKACGADRASAIARYGEKRSERPARDRDRDRTPAKLLCLVDLDFSIPDVAEPEVRSFSRKRRRS